MSDPENVTVTAGYIAVTPGMLAGSGLLRDLLNALPPMTTSMKAIRYIREGEYLDYDAYDGGVLLDSEHEPIPLRSVWRRPWRDEWPTRIVEVRSNAVELAADEAVLLARSKRCACGHLSVFHTRDSEYGTSCIEDCECSDLRTGLTSA